MVQGNVFSLNLDGSGITQLGTSRYGGFFDVEHLNTIAVYNGTLYVADSAESGNCGCGVFTPQIVTIPTTGGTFSTLFAGAPLVHPTTITIGNGTVFVGDGTTIWMLPPSGNSTPVPLVSGLPFTGIAGLSLLNNVLYVTDGSNSLYEVDLSAHF